MSHHDDVRMYTPSYQWDGKGRKIFHPFQLSVLRSSSKPVLNIEVSTYWKGLCMGTSACHCCAVTTLDLHWRASPESIVLQSWSLVVSSPGLFYTWLGKHRMYITWSTELDIFDFGENQENYDA